MALHTAAPCRFYAQGNCRHGASCRYSHVRSSSTAAAPCRFHQQKPGSCKHGDSCAFNHQSAPDNVVQVVQAEQQSLRPAIPVATSPGVCSPTRSVGATKPAPSSSPETPSSKGHASPGRPPVTPLFSPRSLLTESLRSDDDKSDATGSTLTVDTTPVSLHDFEVLVQIGDGMVGRVYVVRHNATGAKYAMKVMDKQQIVSENMHTIIAEREVLEEVRHPFVVRLHFAFQTPEKLILVMEFLPGGDLAYHLRARACFDEDTSRFYAAEIALALHHLHTNHIIHRDLKCANILLDEEGHVRLTDFGMSKKLRDDDGSLGFRGNNTYCGTEDYMAPEIRAAEGHGAAADWWSFGIILYEMLVGQRPFTARDEAAKMAKLNAGKVAFPEGAQVSPEAKRLIRRLLVREPSERVGFQEVMRDPFFDCIDWEALAEKEVEPPVQPYVDPDEDVFVGNFPSSITDRTPPDADELLANLTGALTYNFRSFTYTSPSVVTEFAKIAPAVSSSHLVAPDTPMSVYSEEDFEVSHERLNLCGVASAPRPVPRQTRSPDDSTFFRMSPLQ